MMFAGLKLWIMYFCEVGVRLTGIGKCFKSRTILRKLKECGSVSA